MMAVQAMGLHLRDLPPHDLSLDFCLLSEQYKVRVSSCAKHGLWVTNKVNQWQWMGQQYAV